MRIWNSWDEEQRESAVRITGICIAVLTVFILISTVSYLFSWKQDMSLLSADGQELAADDIGNAAGRLGFRTGHLLVGELFGLGSLALPLILGALSVRLLARKWHYSLLKTFLAALFGALLSSLLLAYCGHLAGIDTVFGGGLGGRCGTTLVLWAEVQFGAAVTGLLIVLLIAVYFFFLSRRFCRWLSSLGRSREHRRKGKAEDKVRAAGCSTPEAGTPAEAGTDEEGSVLQAQDPAGEAKPVSGDGQTAAETLERTAMTETDTSVSETKEAATGAEPGTGSAEGGNFEIIHDDSLNAEVKEELKPIDNRLDPPDGLPYFDFPPSLEMLQSYASSRYEVSSDELTRNNNKIRTTLANYRIQVTDVKAKVGPTVTLYKVYPAPGVKIADIKKLQEDIAMSLNAKGVRVVTLSDSVGIEVANDHSSIVSLKSLLNDGAFRSSKAELPVAIGYTITQTVKVFDLADAPHLLIAGATKQGKSVCLNVIVSSLLYSKHPSELKFVFIDPKRVEFTAYASLLQHYLAVLPDAGSQEEEEARF